MTGIHVHLARMPLIAILRGISPSEAVPVGQALVRAGIELIEVPMNSPQAVESVARLRIALPAARIGAGTVTTTAQVDELARTGAQMIISPHADADVVARTKEHGMWSLPGVATPTEAFAMRAAGADALKLFPAAVLGQAGMQALASVLPRETLLIPVGAVDEHNAMDWLRAGAAGLGIGGNLYRPGMSPADVESRAAALIRAVSAGREN